MCRNSVPQSGGDANTVPPLTHIQPTFRVPTLVPVGTPTVAPAITRRSGGKAVVLARKPQ